MLRVPAFVARFEARRHGEVVGPDKDGVNPRHGEDVAGVSHCLDGFDHDHADRMLPIAVHVARPNRTHAPHAARRIPARAHGRPCLLH